MENYVVTLCEHAFAGQRILQSPFARITFDAVREFHQEYRKWPSIWRLIEASSPNRRVKLEEALSGFERVELADETSYRPPRKPVVIEISKKEGIRRLLRTHTAASRLCEAILEAGRALLDIQADLASKGPVRNLPPEELSELVVPGEWNDEPTDEDVAKVAEVIETARGTGYRKVGGILRKLRTKYNIGSARAVATLRQMWRQESVKFAHESGADLVRLVGRPTLRSEKLKGTGRSAACCRGRQAGASLV